METTSTLSNNMATTFVKRGALASAEKNLVIYPIATQDLIPQGSGLSAYLQRYSNISNNTNTLTEGVAPTETTLDINRYTVTLSEYGEYMRISTLLSKAEFLDTLKAAGERLGYDAYLKMDTVIRDHIISNATTNIQYVGAGNSADNDITSTSESFTAPDVLKCVRLLEGDDAPYYDKGSYLWIVHPYIAADLQGDTAAGGFQDIVKYTGGGSDKVMNGEFGMVYNTRVVKSSNVTSASNSSTINVYRTFVVAKDAVHVTKFDKNAIQTYIEQPGGQVDPLHQLRTIGYKMQFGVKYVGGTFTGENGAAPDLLLQLRGAATAG